jgi:carboxyl-terminal processing protease
MWRKTISYFLFAICLVSSGFGAQQALKVSDIHKVLGRFFSFHIETRELTPNLVKRSMKVYIEQFDPDKSYLLGAEVAPYLNLSDKQVSDIIGRLEAQDYSDFEKLNGIFAKAIYRAEANRKILAKELLADGVVQISSLNTSYANDTAELLERQRARMARFYASQEARTNLSSKERRAKVFALYEKKSIRAEAPSLFQDGQKQPLSAEKRDHIFATKVLKAMAKSLDTHTTFFSPEEAHEMRLSLEKQFQGMGVVLAEGIDGILIADLVRGGPADKSGKIEVNDILVEIDGLSVENLQFEDVLDMLSKKKDEKIHLRLKRPTGDLYHVALRKEPILIDEERIQTSFERVEGGVIGKITLHSFYENSNGVSSENDIKAAIQSFRQEGELLGLVLDLRNNSGGFLSQAVKVSGLFISNGVVVISKYGTGEFNFLRSIAGRAYFSGPVVVLTSKMSASAAEIVAQALQDYGVGIVAGDVRTFGKGSIQYQNVTDERADMFFKITVGRYYTVSGRSTQIDGVQADIVLPTKYAPYNIGERYLDYPLSRDSVKPAYMDPLSDLDPRTQKIFQQRYIPYLQRYVPFWKKMLPQLKKQSEARISKNSRYKAFIRANEKIQARQGTLLPNTIDEGIQMDGDDLQMTESVNIIKDMIDLEAQSRTTGYALPLAG